MIENQYSYFLNQLQMGSKGRNYFFEVRLTTKLKPLARLLQSLNLIRRFHRSGARPNAYRVFPTYSRHRKHARVMRLYARRRGRIVLNLRALHLLNLTAPHSYYILETPKGIMTHQEAITLRTGGLLLAIIN